MTMLTKGYATHYEKLENLVLESQAQLSVDLPEYALADLRKAKVQLEILERWLEMKLETMRASVVS